MKTFPPYPQKPHRTGYARISICRHDHYLGPFGSAESWAEYNRLLAQWLAHGAAAFAKQPVTAASLTVRQLVTAFLEWCQLHRSKATHYGYAAHCNALAGLHGDLPAVQAQPHHIEAWVDGKLRSGSWGPVSAFNAKRAVFRAFSWAAKRKLIAANPLDGLERPPPRSDKRALTEAEYRALLREARGPFRRLIFALWHTGARPKELRMLAWADVRPGRIVLAEHKTSATDRHRRDRVIWLTPVTERLLAWIRRRNPAGHVFCNTRGKPWTADALARQVRELRTRCKLAGDVTAYLCRHAWGTRALVNGVSIATTAQLMGNSPSVVAAVYSHLADAHQHLAAAAEQAARRPPRAG